MRERRPIALLDFAIAASLAVVPVMLAMLLLVAVVRPADPALAARRERVDRYVSVRHVAALKTFEAAIVERAADPKLPRDANALLEAIPQCRREWGGAGGVVERMLRTLRHAPAMSTPADGVVAQLARLDAALQRFSTRPNARVGAPLGFDAGRWFVAVQQALANPVESADYPGQRFQLGCADLVGALTALARTDARMLDSLAWRGTEGRTTLARWQPAQQVAIGARQVMRRNPWGGVAGCIYFGRPESDATNAPAYFVAPVRSAQRRLCALPSMVAASAAGPRAIAGEPGAADAVDDPRWMVPPSLLALLQPLDGLRQPAGARYQRYTDGAADTVAHGFNRVRIDGAAVDTGLSIDVTIDPALQALAQKTAACYTGRHDVCRALAMRRQDDKDGPIGQALLEGAMVRMAAVAVIDVASGRIEALAGAMSPCARQEVDGPGRDAGCDRRLPYPVGYRADALLNPAVFHDAMPASTIKPIMAAAFLSDPEVGARWLGAERAAMQRDGPPLAGSLRAQLMRSDSARFLDRMFCFDKGFVQCRRPWDVQAMALAFGWNAGCGAARSGCGKQDLLFGRALDAPAIDALPPLAQPVAYGRLMSEPLAGRLGAAMQLRPPALLDPGILRRCAAGADGRRLSDDDWGKCRGGAVVDVVAEGWGQGHARASALGVAGMMATLAAAANGQTELHRPHLVAALRGAGDAARRPIDPAELGLGAAVSAPLAISRDAAEVILSGLSYSHRAGTARTACEQVFDARRCREIDWLAGKTGTPSFPNDGVSLDDLARDCRGGTSAPHAGKRVACSSLRPYKWYVAAYRAPGDRDGAWTKAIAVLTERNWLKATGQVHGVGDHGPNPSAEIAMQIAARQLGVIPGAAP